MKALFECIYISQLPKTLKMLSTFTQDQNLLNKLSDKALTNGWGNIDQRTIIISSGLDLVNVSNIIITGSSDKSTKVTAFSLKRI